MGTDVNSGPVLTFLSPQAKINDRGIAALAYNVKLGTGVTLGLGASFDTQNLSQAAHKVGASFTFEG
jgi:voltage-dependent anion channel protein 2